MSRAQGSLISVLDAENIEVLRGPQGTLFGRNTTGGAVSYTSSKPNDTFESSIRLTVGNDGRKDAVVSANVPLSDTVFFRGLVSEGETDGYIKRGNSMLGDRDESVYRGQLRIEATDDISIDLTATHTTFATNGDARVITEFEIGDNGLTLGHFKALQTLIEAQGGAPFVNNDTRLVSEDSVPEFCILDDANPYTFDEVCEHPVDSDMTIVTANVEWKINDEFAFKSLTGYTDGGQEASVDNATTGAYNRPFHINFDSFQQEFQLTYRTDDLDFVTGVIFFNETATEDEITFAVNQGNSTSGSRLSPEQVLNGEIKNRRDETYTNETTSYGIYAQGTYKVTEKLKATAGLRYSHDEKTVDIEYRPTVDDSREETGSGTDSWGNVDYRLALAYQYNDDIMFYGSISEAYKAGIANDASIENRSNVDNIIGFIEPEEALGYELGMRSQWLEDRLRVNLTVFKTDYTNRQGQVLAELNGISFFEAVSLGDVYFEGYEGEITYAATESLTLTASFGVVDYEQEDNPDYSLPFVPEESFSLGILHYAELSNNATVSSSLNYGWTGETYSVSNQPKDKTIGTQGFSPSYGVLNGRIEYMPEHDNWSAGLFVNNLLDDYYFTAASGQTWYMGGGSTGDYTKLANVARGRNYGVTVTVNF